MVLSEGAIGTGRDTPEDGAPVPRHETAQSFGAETGSGLDSPEHIIRILSRVRRYNAQLNPSPSERLARRLERVTMSIAWALLLLVVAGLLLPTIVGVTLPLPVRALGTKALYLGAFLILAFALVGPVFFICRISRRMDDPAHHALAGFRHEQEIVAELLQSSLAPLEAVDEWLATRVAGIEGRVGLFFGEKVSAIALIAVLGTFVRSLIDAQPLGIGRGSIWLAGAVVAVGVGAVTGAIRLRVVSVSFAYQSQLLSGVLTIAGRRSTHTEPADTGLT
jgi:hypothetical protein